MNRNKYYRKYRKKNKVKIDMQVKRWIKLHPKERAVHQKRYRDKQKTTRKQ